VHLSDGLLPPSLCLGGYAAAALGTGLALRRFDERRIPQIAVMTSLFFVASSAFNVRLGQVSLHLLLNGLLGVVLGGAAVPAILLALLLQWLLLGHGGITTLGLNVVTMAGGALAGHAVFRLRPLLPRGRGLDCASGFLAAVASLVMTGLLYLLVMVLAGPRYVTPAKMDLIAHLPLLLIEPPLTGFAVGFLAQVKPELIGLQEKTS
jgi:cobalt/nickel transport system permease protein